MPTVPPATPSAAVTASQHSPESAQSAEAVTAFGRLLAPARSDPGGTSRPAGLLHRGLDAEIQ